MADIYTVQDNRTGNTITFEWNGPNPPTDQDMANVFAAAQPSPLPPGTPSEETVNEVIASTAAKNVAAQRTAQAKAQLERTNALSEMYGLSPKSLEAITNPKTTSDYLTKMAFEAQANPLEALKIGMGSWPLPVGTAMRTLEPMVSEIRGTLPASRVAEMVSPKVARDLEIAKMFGGNITFVDARPGDRFESSSDCVKSMLLLDWKTTKDVDEWIKEIKEQHED